MNDRDKQLKIDDCMEAIEVYSEEVAHLEQLREVMVELQDYFAKRKSNENHPEDEVIVCGACLEHVTDYLTNQIDYYNDQIDVEQAEIDRLR